MEHAVIFDGLNDTSDARKASMASELLVAGSDTSGTTLTYALYHINSNPEVKDRLTQELNEVMPSIDTVPILVKLEQLSYLVNLPLDPAAKLLRLTISTECLCERIAAISVPCPWEATPNCA